MHAINNKPEKTLDNRYRVDTHEQTDKYRN